MIVAMQQYRDRAEAGHVLARALAHYASRVDSLVLAISGGGVPIASEVAAYLRAPLDTFIVTPLELPAATDVVLGAIAPGGIRVLDHEAIERAEVSPSQLAALASHASQELERRERLLRGRRPPPQLSGRVVIAVDDGLATDSAMHAAVIALLQKGPAWLVAAAPVGALDACAELTQEVHEVVCPLRPNQFEAIGLWYEHFAPISDAEARACLRHAGGLPPV